MLVYVVENFESISKAMVSKKQYLTAIILVDEYLQGRSMTETNSTESSKHYGTISKALGWSWQS